MHNTINKIMGIGIIKTYIGVNIEERYMITTIIIELFILEKNINQEKS